MFFFQLVIAVPILPLQYVTHMESVHVNQDILAINVLHAHRGAVTILIVKVSLGSFFEIKLMSTPSTAVNFIDHI